jgi:hypothetical protein
MSDGFLGRWSKRKLEVKEGRAVEAEPVVANVPPPQLSPAGGGSEQPEQPVVVARVEPAVPPPPPAESEAPPLPTLEEVKSLTAQSDFTRFTAPNVTPEVKNAALKKLFSDPHYNIMDGLDVYIDDYSQPDPMPDSMIRQLASVKFLNLFAREEKEEAEAEAARQAREVANNPTEQTVAQSETAPPANPPAVPEPPDHADPDLRLQQDHAAPGEEPGYGAG